MIPDLRRYWPGGLTNLLLKAAFHVDAETARQSWQTWLATCDFDKSLWNDLRVASHAHRRLGGLSQAGALEPRLRGLQRYIWSAGRMRIDAALPLLKEFSEQKVTFMPIKGSVLLARDPKAMADRFIADIDVLVEQASWEKAVDISLKGGWSSAWKLERDSAVHRMRQTHHALELQRGAHGAVDLHQFSLLLNRQLGADSLLWQRAGQGALSGLPVRLPHPSDQLAIIFGHCFLYANPRTYDWVPDALATISAPGFDWTLFTEVVLDRELAVPAAAALTYLAEELNRPIPAPVLERVVAHLREPFLSEFAASYRAYVSDVGEECRAIYDAECIRARRFIKRAPVQSADDVRQKRVTATLSDVKPDEKIVLPMPSGVRPSDRIQFRLQFDLADELSKVLGAGKSPLIMLRCFDYIPLELGRLRIRPRPGQPHELAGEIDGALVVGRGIDQLWLSVTVVEADWLRKLHEMRARLSQFARSGRRRARLYSRLRNMRDRMVQQRNGPAGGEASQQAGQDTGPGIIRGGSFEAVIAA